MSDTPAIGSVRFGDLDRTDPIGIYFSAGRGTSVDRHYVHAFLERNRADVRGRVLEVLEDRYTRLYGGERVSKSDVLDLEPNQAATIRGDLSAAGTLPRDAFDCIILTQTLQFIYDARGAAAELHAALKPGGVLLVTAPGISQIDPSWEWHWTFSRASLSRLFGDVFGRDSVAIESYGNVFAAIAMLHGIATEEIAAHKLAVQHDLYPVTLTVRAVKSASPAPASRRAVWARVTRALLRRARGRDLAFRGGAP
jgi:SAM-dependent methyltransferase